MKVDTDTDTTTGQAVTSAPRTRRTDRTPTRVVAGALLAGAVIALALSLAVFPGATESVITGSLLVGFGCGWAVLAALSVRRTSQPQRWAAVPAVAMTATGLGLVAFAPGDAAMSAINCCNSGPNSRTGLAILCSLSSG